MIPQNTKMDFSYKPSKGYDTANATYKKYGKEIRVKDYINEFNEGCIAKDVIKKAGGLNQLPGAMARIPDSGIVIDMNEDLFTINRKIKMGQIAQRKVEFIKAQEAAMKAQQQTEQGGNE